MCIFGDQLKFSERFRTLKTQRTVFVSSALRTKSYCRNAFALSENSLVISMIRCVYKIRRRRIAYFLAIYVLYDTCINSRQQVCCYS